MSHTDEEVQLAALVMDIGAKPSGVEEALMVVIEFGGIDGAHHKQWVLDQVLRCLAGDRYHKLVRLMKAGEDGPNTYGWEEGIAP